MTEAITPIPRVPKLDTSAAASSLVIPSRIPGASSSAWLSRLPATQAHSNTSGKATIAPAAAAPRTIPWIAS